MRTVVFAVEKLRGGSFCVRWGIGNIDVEKIILYNNSTKKHTVFPIKTY